MNNEPAYFVLEPDSSTTPVTWKIVVQEDRSASGAIATEESTWGSIKALYQFKGMWR